MFIGRSSEPKLKLCMPSGHGVVFHRVAFPACNYTAIPIVAIHSISARALLTVYTLLTAQSVPAAGYPGQA